MLEVILLDSRVTLSEKEQQQYGALRKCSGSVKVNLTLEQWEALQREIAAPSQISGEWCEVLESAYVVNHKELLRKMLPRISDYFGAEPISEKKVTTKLAALEDD
jgi:hypothetical protein